MYYLDIDDTTPKQPYKMPIVATKYPPYKTS